MPKPATKHYGRNPNATKPAYRLKVLNKETEGRGEVGCGWLNKDGSITIKLNPCVVLTPNPAIVFTLFPADERTVEAAQKSADEATNANECPFIPDDV